MFTSCAHTSLPQSIQELCKTNVTTYPCRLPKSNPEAISIYSASIVRCVTLKKSIKHVFIASLGHWQEKKQGNIQESLTCSTRTGTLARRDSSFLKPCLVFLETTVQERGLQGTRRKEPTVTTPFIQRVLTFSHLGVLS